MSIPTIMRALQLQAVNRLAEVQWPTPLPAPDEVLVRTVTTTICTSDLNDIARNPFGITLPRILGHEATGVVAAVGGQVSGFSLGDRVAAHPVIPCRLCANCRRGLAHLCSNMGHLGIDRDGTFAEFFCLRADRCRRLPPGVDSDSASLLEPVAVCLEAVQRGRIQPGETVLVVGDGPFGLLIARLACASKPAKIIVVGRHEFRLRHVPEAVTINASHASDVMRAVHESNNGQGVDVAMLATGSASGLELALASVRARGRVVAFSPVQGTPRVDWFRVHTQELEILGACNDECLFDAALERLADPALRLSSLITHSLPFEQWPRAFELARGGKDEALKVALRFVELP